MSAYMRIVTPLILFGVFSWSSWRFVHGSFDAWQMFFVTFGAFFLLGSSVFRWGFSGIVFRFLSIAVLFPGAITFLIRPTFEILEPKWWVGQPLVQWFALLGGFLLGLVCFWIDAEQLLSRTVQHTERPRPRSLHSQSAPIVAILLLTLLLTYSIYPSIEKMGQYADIVLHTQGITALSGEHPMVSEGTKVGYALGVALQVFTGIPHLVLLWVLQWAIRFLFGLTAFVLLRRWFSRELAFLGAFAAIFFPPILITFPQAFLANVGIFLASLFFLVFLNHDSGWRSALVAGTLFLATLFTNPWFTGYLPLIALGWCLVRFSQNQYSKKDRILGAMVFFIGIAIVLTWIVDDLRFFDPQVSIFRSFIEASNIRSFVYSSLLIATIGTVALLRGRKRISFSSVVNGALLAIFLLDVGNHPLLFVLALSSWAVSLWSTKQKSFALLERHELFFLLVVFLNILMLVVQSWKLSVGNHGAFYLLPIPLAYFVLYGLSRWHSCFPRVVRIALPLFLLVFLVGALYTQFGYISRILYATPTEVAFGITLTLLLAFIGLFIGLSLWRIKDNEQSS